MAREVREVVVIPGDGPEIDRTYPANSAAGLLARAMEQFEELSQLESARAAELTGDNPNQKTHQDLATVCRQTAQEARELLTNHEKKVDTVIHP